MLRIEQAEFDDEHFDPVGGLYEPLSRRDAKVARIGLLVTEIAGCKLQTYKAGDMGKDGKREMKREIIPDLMMHSTQLANAFELSDDPFEDYRPKHHSSDRICGLVSEAAGSLAHYIEPLLRGAEPNLVLPEMAAENLYKAALDLGRQFKVDPFEAQLNRLAFLQSSMPHGEM